tara:strand:+ start:252 stop:2150 length:1899 start_codon:yes stop_codon:yes gene_type:complete
MKSFQAIQEERGEKAFKQAIAMGLKYGGFGYWKDPQSGETKFKTENDTLIPVEPEESSELAGKGGPGSNGMADGQMGGGMMGAGGMGNMMGPGGMLQMPGQQPGSGILGAPEPGEETPEGGERKGWEPGPDGDTCAGPDAQDPADVPKDTYVGTTNYAKWVAGPDGDNMNTVTAASIQEESEVPNRALERMGKIMGRKPASGETNARAQSAMNKMADNNPTEFGRQVQSMINIAGRQAGGNTERGKESPSHLEGGKENDMWRKAGNLPDIQKKADVVKALNQESRPLVKDPEYKMDQYDEDEGYLDEGSFGSVFEDKNGNVVKRGEIGIRELNALSAMKDNPRFPTLINAKFDSPFRSVRDAEMEEYEDYMDTPDSDDTSGFFNSAQTARGTYAMTQAKGIPLAEITDDMDDEIRDKMHRNFWKARGDFHKAGFAHNDMHGGNVFVDPETGEVNIIDLGLAQEDQMGALMEALGGLDYEQGMDGQLDRGVSGAQLPQHLMDKFDNNRGDMEQEMMDGMGDLDFEDPKTDDIMKAMAGMLTGGIRMKPKQLQELRDSIPYLQDDNNIMSLIKTLYKEVGQGELSDRMGAAFDKKQKDSKVIRAADRIRKSKGQPPIEIKNKNVIPPKNMDFDD